MGRDTFTGMGFSDSEISWELELSQGDLLRLLKNCFLGLASTFLAGKSSSMLSKSLRDVESGGVGLTWGKLIGGTLGGSNNTWLRGDDVAAGGVACRSSITGLARLLKIDFLYVAGFLASLEGTLVMRAGKFRPKSGLSALKIGSLVLLYVAGFFTSFVGNVVIRWGKLSSNF